MTAQRMLTTFLILFLSMASAVAAEPIQLFNFGSAKVAIKVAKQIDEMTFDYQEASEGRPPKFAKNTSGIITLDGGTTSYEGRGYILTIQRSVGSVGGVSGMFYGPIVHFTDPLLGSDARKVSNVQFYSLEEYRKKIEKKK